VQFGVAAVPPAYKKTVFSYLELKFSNRKFVTIRKIELQAVENIHT